MPIELTATAREINRSGTRRGISACCAGFWNPLTAPSATDIARIKVRSAQPPNAATVRTSPTTVSTIMQSTRMKPRLPRSAACPAGRVSTNAGRNCNSPTNPKSHALPVRLYICQPSATIII